MLKSNVSLLILLASIVTTTACGGGYNSSKPGSNQSGFDITVYAQTTPSIPITGSVDVRAAGYYGPNHSYRDLTSSATWSTSNAAVATVSSGRVTGTGVGSAEVTAASGGKSESITVVVGLTPSIAIVPSPSTAIFSLSANPQQQFIAAATYSDGSKLDLTAFVTWSSSAEAVLAFSVNDPYDFNPGLATLRATGTATITATEPMGETGSLVVTVVP